MQLESGQQFTEVNKIKGRNTCFPDSRQFFPHGYQDTNQSVSRLARGLFATVKQIAEASDLVDKVTANLNKMQNHLKKPKDGI